MLSYQNAPAAIDWLVAAFGFTEHARMLGNDGLVSHAELRLGNAVIFLATPTPAYQSPRTHAQSCPAARAWQQSPWVIDGVLIFVSDIDAHFHRAQSAGAKLLSQLEDGYPGRRYRAEDCEGHRWMFMQHAAGV
jgi:uncharacterized glyoxalase superfamily protein PhnB